MYQVHFVPSAKVVASNLSTLREAQAEACKHTNEHLKTTPHGRRFLAWCKGRVQWKDAQQYVVISEMVGVWIETHGGRVLPEDLDDSEKLLFKNQRGDILFGTFDPGEQTFFNEAAEHYLSAERVTAFLIVPEK